MRFDEPMARHTTLRIGGPVDAWVAPTNQRVIAPLRKRCHELGIAIARVRRGLEPAGA